MKKKLCIATLSAVAGLCILSACTDANTTTYSFPTIEGATERIVSYVGKSFEIPDVVGKSGEKELFETVSVIDPDGETVLVMNNAFQPEKIGSYTIRYTVKDDKGNSAVASTVLEVKKNVYAPQITLQGNNVEKAKLNESVEVATARAVDAFGEAVEVKREIYSPRGEVVSLEADTLVLSELGQYKILYTATDTYGLSATEENNVYSYVADRNDKLYNGFDSAVELYRFNTNPNWDSFINRDSLYIASGTGSMVVSKNNKESGLAWRYYTFMPNEFISTDFTENAYISFKVYNPQEQVCGFALVSNNKSWFDANNYVTLSEITVKAGAWATISVRLSDFVGTENFDLTKTYLSLLPSSEVNTFYLDDFYYGSEMSPVIQPVDSVGGKVYYGDEITVPTATAVFADETLTGEVDRKIVSPDGKILDGSNLVFTQEGYYKVIYTYGQISDTYVYQCVDIPRITVEKINSAFVGMEKSMPECVVQYGGEYLLETKITDAQGNTFAITDNAFVPQTGGAHIISYVVSYEKNGKTLTESLSYTVDVGVPYILNDFETFENASLIKAMQLNGSALNGTVSLNKEDIYAFSGSKSLKFELSTESNVCIECTGLCQTRNLSNYSAITFKAMSTTGTKIWSVKINSDGSWVSLYDYSGMVIPSNEWTEIRFDLTKTNVSLANAYAVAFYVNGGTFYIDDVRYEVADATFDIQSAELGYVDMTYTLPTGIISYQGKTFVADSVSLIDPLGAVVEITDNGFIPKVEGVYIATYSYDYTDYFGVEKTASKVLEITVSDGIPEPVGTVCGFEDVQISTYTTAQNAWFGAQGLPTYLTETDVFVNTEKAYVHTGGKSLKVVFSEGNGLHFKPQAFGMADFSNVKTITYRVWSLNGTATGSRYAYMNGWVKLGDSVNIPAQTWTEITWDFSNTEDYVTKNGSIYTWFNASGSYYIDTVTVVRKDEPANTVQGFETTVESDYYDNHIIWTGYTGPEKPVSDADSPLTVSKNTDLNYVYLGAQSLKLELSSVCGINMRPIFFGLTDFENVATLSFRIYALSDIPISNTKAYMGEWIELGSQTLNGGEWTEITLNFNAYENFVGGNSSVTFYFTKTGTYYIDSATVTYKNN